MWSPGDIVMWRGIRRERVWHAQPTIVVRDNPDELVLTLLPGTECMAEETYPMGKPGAKHWWDFNDNGWKLKEYIWRTNRLLLLLEPEKCYSTIYFWKHEDNKFLCHYVNFQQPFTRNHNSIDTLDWELDLIVNPDFSYEWKDEDDYQKAVEYGVISPRWEQEIDSAKPEIFDRLERRQYPFDGSWLDWMPDPNWSPPRLPENWDKI